MLNKAYVEITNQCNLSCAFCPKTKRAPGRMTAESFSRAAEALRAAGLPLRKIYVQRREGKLEELEL